MLKKTLASLLGIVFLSFVVVQYNDPDPLLWMLVYGFASGLCFYYAFLKVSHRLLWVTTLLFIAGAIYMWPAQFEGISIGSGNINNIEEARESLGLLFCSLTFMGFIANDTFTARSKRISDSFQKAKWAQR